MFNKLGKKVITSLLTFAMTLGIIGQINVYATINFSFDETKTYAIVDAESGKALNVTDDEIFANGDEIKIEGDSTVAIYEKSALFNILKRTDRDTLGFINVSTGQAITESGRVNDKQWIQAGDGDMDFHIIDAGNETFYIRSQKNQYLKIDENENKKLVGTGLLEDATKFKFVEATYEDKESMTLKASNGKYLTVTNADEAVTATATEVTDNSKFIFIEKGNIQDGYNVVTFSPLSQSDKGLWSNSGDNTLILGTDTRASGWESIIVIPNGDGTISLKSSKTTNYFYLKDNGQLVADDANAVGEKFTIESKKAIDENIVATNLQSSNITLDSVQLSWTPIDQDISKGITTLYTGYKVAVYKDGETTPFKVTDETIENSITIDGLDKGTSYTLKVRTVLGNKFVESTESLKVATKSGLAPAKPTNVQAELSDDKQHIVVTWDKVEGEYPATSYRVVRARSRFDKDGYQEIEDDLGIVTTNSFEDTFTKDDKYDRYYKVIAVNENGESEMSDDYGSLEKTMFGKYMYIFSPHDDPKMIDETVQTIFKEETNNYDNDAQFQSNHYAFYYKAGDYRATECLPVGFYTHVGGLGKTPYDVKLNNIEVPAYLDGNPNNNSEYHYEDGVYRNATCNFWRSAENLSVVGEGDASVAEKLSRSQNWKSDWFNWSVAQAAPLRRIYSTRKVSYDWSYGWASGGYTADCYFTSDAQTPGGQQYFTRNSKIDGDATGTWLNNFNMGVESESLTKAATTKLESGKGYTNWNLGSDQGKITNITETPKVSEKPFLYINPETGEYEIFAPSMRNNSTGTSWSENNMGEGQSYSLDEFYVVKADEDSSVRRDIGNEVNAALNEGKNIFFLPGVYETSTPIQVNNEDTIVLGTGMATIVPTNSEAAMIVADEKGIKIAGLIFDAGTYSKYLLKVGNEKNDNDNSSNPVVLQDIFFRVGGTTSATTYCDDALEINSNDVICDHFWIWRADHGAGVTWTKTPAKHGLVVNGDNVTCLALFNEHFEEYDTLWNGENGATYFYQNEKCYDPISQETWMSHEGLSNGYAAYKVSNTVKNHYAVGFGMYNVFIYTGGTDEELGDSSQVGITLDNAMEVPNAEGVLIENACIQTFAKDEGALQKFNHIINDCGEGVSSGTDVETGEKGEGANRKYILTYQNGVCHRGTTANPVEEYGKQPYNEKNDVDLSELIKAYGECKDLFSEENEAIYTEETYLVYKELMEEYATVYENETANPYEFVPTRLKQEEVPEVAQSIRDAYAALTRKGANYDEFKEIIEQAEKIIAGDDYTKDYYTQDTVEEFKNAYQEAIDLNTELDITAQDEIDGIKDKLIEAIEGLDIKDADVSSLEKVINDVEKVLNSSDYKNNYYTQESQNTLEEAYQEAMTMFNRTDLTIRNQEDIDNVVDSLNNAKTHLELKAAQYSQLEKAFNKAEYIILSDNYTNHYYTNESREAFDKAYNNAKELLDNQTLTIKEQSIIDNATKVLTDATNDLEIAKATYNVLQVEFDKVKDVINSENYKNNYYTKQSQQAFTEAYENAKALLDNQNLTIKDQVKVNNARDALMKAYGQLEIAKANYTKLLSTYQEAKGIVNSGDYSSHYYTEESKEAFDIAYNAALDLVNDYEDGNSLEIMDQKIIDQARSTLDSSMKQLQFKEANYTPLVKAMERANAIKEGANYKNNSYVTYTKELFDYYYQLGLETLNTQNTDNELNIKDQALIEARAANVHNGIDQLLLMPAKTDNLEELIKFAETNIRDGEYFENEYYKNVAQFLDYLQKARIVIKDANINDQEVIDQTYDDLYNAILNLELKDADYTELESLRNQAKEIVLSENYVNARYTQETVAVFNAANRSAMAFSNDYFINDQMIVDAQAQQLKDAIEQLQLKEEIEEDVVEDPTDEGEEIPGELEPVEDDITDVDDSQTSTTVKNPTTDKTSTTNKPSATNQGVKTGDNAAIVEFGLLAMASAGAYLALRKKHEN